MMTSYFKGGKDDVNMELMLSQRESKPKSIVQKRRKKSERTCASLDIIEEGMEKAFVAKPELGRERIDLQDDLADCYGHA